jgi:hypothetical protein
MNIREKWRASSISSRDSSRLLGDLLEVRRMTARAWSPELETLDQLLGGDLTLDVIRRGWPDDARFLVGVKGLVSSGDVLLLTRDGGEVATWRWRQLFDDKSVLAELSGFCLRLTNQGSAKVA